MNIYLGLTWLICGLLFGFSFGVSYAAVYGDPDTNEKVAEIRRNRVEIEQVRLELEHRKLIRAIFKKVGIR